MTRILITANLFDAVRFAHRHPAIRGMSRGSQVFTTTGASASL